MPFFRPKPPIDIDEFDWLVACFAWLRNVLQDAHIKPEFVMPNQSTLQDASTGPELFEAVRSLVGMEEWPCRVELVEAREFMPELGLIEEAGACGTFSVENGEAIIRYSSDMLQRREALAATFAHELAHFLLMEVGNPPGGPDLLEHATDCAAIYLGFGVLLSNTARHEEHRAEVGGWSWRSSNIGYLSEPARVTATALFAALHGYELDGASDALKPHLSKDLKKASKFLRHRHPDIANSLQQVDLGEWQFD